MKNKLLGNIMARYIDFVYRTSKITYSDNIELLRGGNESFLALFWHGDSFSLYPALKGCNLFVITTINQRGNYITDICDYFNYKVIRVPDESRDQSHMMKMINEIKINSDYNVALAMDGPLGPYHEPKDLSFVLPILTKRRVLPVSIKVSKKIVLSRRWDNFNVPLPFGRIEITFHDPLIVERKDREEHFAGLKNKLKEIMNS